MEQNNNKLQKIIQGGAVGLCVLLIVLLGWVLNNVFNHLTESVKTQQELVGAVNKLDNTINRFINALKIKDF